MLLGDSSGRSDLPATVIMPDPRITEPVQQHTFPPGAAPQPFIAPPHSWQPARAPYEHLQISAQLGRGAAVTSFVLAATAFGLLGFCILGGATGVKESLLGGIFIFSTLLALAGAIFGIVAAARSNRDTSPRNSRAMSLVALVLNGLYLLISVVFLILGAASSL